VGDYDIVAWRHAPVDERALARPRDTGHDRQHTERDIDIDMLQVVQRRIPDRQRLLWLAHLILQGHPMVEVLPGKRAGRSETGEVTFVADLPAIVTGTG